MPTHGYVRKCLTNCFIGIGLVFVIILTFAKLDKIPQDFNVNVAKLQITGWEFATGANDNELNIFGGAHRRFRRDSGDIVENTTALLAEGDSLIEMSNQTDIILVVGNTGAGKSTLVQFLAGDNDKLESYKKSGTYLIRDLGGKISIKTTISKSIFPELVVQNETNAAFYDCPGFSDTRNQQPYIEIGNSFFIKKVAEHGTRIKIILVVNIFSLQANADRNDFPSLLKQVTILIKDVAKFEKGIALVATKVKSSESDEEEIENIASFLNDLREELPETLPEKSVGPALQVLDAILTKKDGEYNRIGLFRAPNQVGFLSRIPKVQENRHNLLQMIHHEIEYVNKTENDFGYALSPNAIILINDLVLSINRNITLGLQTICDRIGDEFSQELRSMLVNLDSDSPTLLERLNKLLSGSNTKLADADAGKSSIVLKNIIEKIRQFSGTTVGIEKDLKNLVNQGHYLDFLQNAREDQTLAIEFSLWYLPVQNLGKSWSTHLSSNFTLNLHISLFKSLETVSQEITLGYIESREIPLNKLITSLDYLKNIQLNLKTEFAGMGLGEFVRQIISSLKYTAGSDIIIANESKILDQINKLESIERIIPKELQLKWEPLKWIQPLTSAINKIEDEKSWKEYLTSLMEELSEAKVQVTNEWGLRNYSLTQNLNTTFVDKFLPTNTVKHRGRERVQTFFADERRGDMRLNVLKELLNTTLTQSRSTTCEKFDGDTVTIIRGRYVVLSSALSCVPARVTKTLVILASHTIFIDKSISGTSLNRNGNPDVIIIAPNWKIIGPIIFDLNGASGTNYGGNRQSKATWTGQSGAPGPPGQNGGHFFGIGQRFEGDSELKINVNGGHGGSGQPGGDGGDGSKGHDAYMMGVEHSDPGWMLEAGASCWQNGNVRINQSPYGHTSQGRRGDVTTFTYLGGSGTKGFAGGSGGKGGLGGYPGSFALIGMQNQTKVVLSGSSVGSAGTDGPGGTGGCHGVDGNSMKVDFFARYCTGCAAFRCKYGHRHHYPAGVCSKGRASSGTRGGNSNGRTTPVPTHSQFEKLYGKFIIAFKDLAFSEVSNQFLKSSLSEFLLQLDVKTKSIVSYQKMDMFNELITLETHFAFTLKNKENLIPFYESLLKRTYETGLNLRGEAYKANAVLYGATLSKLCHLKSPLEPYLIVDIAKYFELAKQTAQKFQTQWTNQQRLEIVEKSKDEFMTQIEEKFSEAQDLIINVINPEIEKIHTRIQENIERLVKEIEELRKQKLQEIEALERKEAELREQMRMDAIFGALKMGTQIVGCFGPYGQAAGSVLGAGIGMAEQFSTPGSSAESKIVALPAAIQNLQSDLSSQYGKYAKGRLDYFQLQINDMQRLLSSDDYELDKKSGTAKPNVIMNKINDVNEKIKVEQKKIALLKKVDKSKLSADAMKTLTDSETVITKSKEELKTLLTESEASLKNEAEKTARIQNRLQKVGQAVQIVSMGTEIYAKYKDSQSHIDIINEQIEKSKEEQKRIEEHKENVYKIMIPTIEEMRGNMDKFQSTLGNRSGVALEVGKWKVTSALKDMRSQIKLFTEGFLVDKDMMRCFEMLEEAMTTLINVYDRLESYGDQAKLVKFISSVNSAAFVNLAVTDPDLRGIVQELEIVIQANVLIQQYESALNSFKMWVFPFGNLYMLDLTQLPSIADSWAWDSKGLKNMASIVSQNIDKLSSKLQVYKTSIVSYDQGLHFRNFGELAGGGADSFHVWKNGDYSNEIRKILSGEKIVLKASVSNCPSGMNAIKFRKLDLKFKVVGNSSEDADTELTNALKGYKVVLTHGGSSYYNYDTKVVVISSKKITLSFSFLKNSGDGLPHDRNAVYEKLRTGDLVLSPYTVWEIQLVPVVADSGFRRLAQLARMKIDLQMNGQGTYVINRMGK